VRNDYLFVMPVCSSIRPHGTTVRQWMDFRGIKYLNTSWKSVNIIQVWSNLKTITGTLHEDQCTVVFIFVWIILRMKNVSDKISQKIKTHFKFHKVFRKLCCLWDNVGKYSRAGQGTDGNMAHVLCVRDNLEHSPKLRISNIYCFFTTTIFERRCLNITL